MADSILESLQKKLDKMLFLWIFQLQNKKDEKFLLCLYTMAKIALS
jgi:hypothetical protein